jgi:hypothetical protein
MSLASSSAKPPSLRLQPPWSSGAGLFFLILLAGLQLIWPIPTLIWSLALAIGCLCLIRPYFALALAILLMSFECVRLEYAIPGNIVYSLPIFFILIVVGLVCWYFSYLAGLATSYPSTTLDLPLAIFWISSLIAVLWSNYFYNGIGVIILHTAGYSLFLLICALNTNTNHVERLFLLLFVVGLLVVITTIASFFFEYKIQYILTDNISIQTAIRQFKGVRVSLTGFMGHAKAIVLMLDNTIILGLGLMCTRTSRWSRVCIYLGILAMLFIHILTLSRVDTVALFCGWLTFVYLHPQWRPKMLRQHFYMTVSVLIVFIALFTVLSVFFAGGELVARFTGTEQTLPGYRFSALQGRWDFMYYALRELWATGGLGRGTGGIMKGFDPNAIVMAPNLYFSVLVDHGFGFLSLILFGWIGANLIMELHRALRDCADARYRIFLISAASSLAVYAVAGLGDHLYMLYDEWLVLAVTVAAINGARWLKTTGKGINGAPA